MQGKGNQGKQDNTWLIKICQACWKYDWFIRTSPCFNRCWWIHQVVVVDCDVIVWLHDCMTADIFDHVREVRQLPRLVRHVPHQIAFEFRWRFLRGRRSARFKSKHTNHILTPAIVNYAPCVEVESMDTILKQSIKQHSGKSKQWERLQARMLHSGTNIATTVSSNTINNNPKNR